MMRWGAPITWVLALTLLLSACAEQDAGPETVAATAATSATESALDPLTGLKMTGDWEVVRAACTTCHSSKLITQQRGSAEQWLIMIRWMQKKQNLWLFDTPTEHKIIAYLAEHYPPSDAQRRAPIPPELMPINPYANTVGGPSGPTLEN